MGESLTLPVPETLHGTYAVALPEPLPDPGAVARDRVTRRTPPPLRDLVLGMLGSPMLTLDQRPSGDFPPLPHDLLTAYGAAPADLAAVAGAPYLLVVRAAYRPGRPPAHEWASRAVAGVLAAGPVVDVFTPQVLTPDRLERSLPGPSGATRLTDWMLLPHTRGPSGVLLTTRGLARFGLPELRTENVPPELVEPWGRLLNGVAHRVLELWLDEVPSGALVVDIPEIVSVGRHDMAAAQGATDPVRREAPVRLSLAEPPDPVLDVLPAEGAPADLCAALFND